MATQAPLFEDAPARKLRGKMTPEEKRRRKHDLSQHWPSRTREKQRERNRRYRLKHPGRGSVHSRKYRLANLARVRAWKQEWQRNNPDRVAAMYAFKRIRRQQKRLNGTGWLCPISIDDYIDLLVRQESKCAICFTTRSNSRHHRLFLDHDHKTGLVRGMLCSRCNSTLGYMDDDSHRLRRAADYLEAAQAKSLEMVVAG